MRLYLEIVIDLEKGIKVRGLGSIPNPKKDKTLKESDGKFPIGTIRTWTIGDVIKKDDTTWIPIEIPDQYYYISQDIGKIANQIFYQKDPIDGELVVEYLLKKHLSEIELGRGNFRKYTDDFIPKFIKFSIDVGLQQHYIAKKYLEESDDFISLERMNEMKEQFSYYNEQMKKKGGLEEGDKEIFEAFLKEIKSFPDEYISLSKILKQIEYIKEHGKKWKDNFIITTTLDISIEKYFKEYKQKFRKRIIKEEGSRMIEEAGLKVDSPTEEFYPKLLKQLIKFEEDPSISNIYRGELKEFINAAFGCRFDQVLDIELSGDQLWDGFNTPALMNFERLAFQLPVGHLLKNNELIRLKNHSYDGHGEGSAYYNGEGKTISLSNAVLKTAQFSGNLKEPDEFNSTISHEVGHAVAKKLREANNVEFKRFCYLCGWDYRQSRKENFFATSGDKKIKRKGSKNDISLLSEYSYQSPNEAFAEYYSFYYLNKEKIDKWLETGDKKDLYEKALGKFSEEDKKLWFEQGLKKIKITTLISTNELKKDWIKQKGGDKTGVIEILAFKKQKGEFFDDEILESPIHISYNDIGKIKLYKKLPITETFLREKLKKVENGYLVWGGQRIPINIIEKNFLPLKQMKEKIFENEKIIKALRDLGIDIICVK